MNLGSNVKCSHCNFAKMEYSGFLIGGRHLYYKCPKCKTVTEYSLSTKNMLISDFLILLFMVLIVVISMTLIEINALLAFLFFLVSYILFLLITNKKRFLGYKKVALYRLPNDTLILRPPPRKIRIIVVVIFTAAVLSYAGIIFINLIRQ